LLDNIKSAKRNKKLNKKSCAVCLGRLPQGYIDAAYGTVPTWQDSRPLLPQAGGILTVPPAIHLYNPQFCLALLNT